MAELDILMQQLQEDGTYNQLYPIAKAFTEMQTSVPVEDRKPYRLYALITQDWTGGGN